LDAPAVLGIVLDGSGWGNDGTIWGGEFLLANYRGYHRLGAFKPVAMPGGAQAVREPWRNLYAHLVAAMGWADFARDYGHLEVFADLARVKRVRGWRRPSIRTPCEASATTSLMPSRFMIRDAQALLILNPWGCGGQFSAISILGRPSR
jgi:hypothetical protein